MKKLIATVTVGLVIAANMVAFADTANVPTTPVWQEQQQTTYEQAANTAGTAMSAEQLNQLLLSTGGVGTFSFTETNGNSLNVNFRVFN